MIEIILNDWPGLLLILLSFYVVVRLRKKWKDDNLTFTLCFVLAMHHVLALTNAYLFIIHGADADAVSFHRLGVEWAMDGKWSIMVGAKFYPQLLGIFYRIFSPSHLFGEELSIIAFLFACFVLIKLINLLNITKYRVGLLLIFGLLPTNLVLGSVTMRESYQILFFMLAVYWGLRFHLEHTKGAMIFCVFSAIIMGFFHKALILYVLFLLPILFLWFPQQISGSLSYKWSFSKRRLITVSLLLVLIIGALISGIQLKVSGLGPVEAFLSGEWLKYAEEYRIRGIEKSASYARAIYGITLDVSSPISLIKSVWLIYIYYLLAPFPWQIINWLDVYAFTESLLRFILIIFSIISWYRSEGLQRSICGLLLIIYFSMTLLWSTGTVNYGTSIRHHLLTNWIIVILGGPVLIDFVLRQFRKKPATLKTIKNFNNLS